MKLSMQISSSLNQDTLLCVTLTDNTATRPDPAEADAVEAVVEAEETVGLRLMPSSLAVAHGDSAGMTLQTSTGTKAGA